MLLALFALGIFLSVMKILLIDDSKLIGRILSNTLSNLNVELTLCTSAHEALQWVENRQFDFVCVSASLSDGKGVDLGCRNSQR